MRRTPGARWPETPTAGLLAALAAGLVLGLAAPAAPADPQEKLVDGVPHVFNPAAPLEGERVRHLEELWRAGGDDDEVFFGSIARAVADDEGNLYLLDGQLSEVKVYGSDGTFLRTLSREGEGPGESRRPQDLFFLPDGSLGLVQTFPGKVVKIDRDGNPAGTMQVGGADPSQGRFGVMVLGRSRGGNIVLAGMHMSMNPAGGMEQNYFLSRCDADGTEQHVYLAKSYPVDFADFVLEESGIDFAWSGRFALGPDGGIYMAPERDRYAIRVLAPDGALQRVIEREFTARERTDEERREAELNLQGIGSSYPVRPRAVTALDTDAAIVGLHVTDAGEIWVANSRDSRDLPEGSLALLDVFDPAGRFVRRLRVAGPGDPERDAVLFPAADRVVVVRGSLDAWRNMQGVAGGEEEPADAAPLEVICYRVAD